MTRHFSNTFIYYYCCIGLWPNLKQLDYERETQLILPFDFWGFKYHLICKIRLKLSTFSDFILSWSWKKSFYYPFQRAGGTPTVPWVMAYTLLNGVLQILSLIWAVTSTVLGALTKFDVFWTLYVFEVKKIVLIPISMGWRDSNSPMGNTLSAINGLSQI